MASSLSRCIVYMVIKINTCQLVRLMIDLLSYRRALITENEFNHITHTLNIGIKLSIRIHLVVRTKKMMKLYILFAAILFKQSLAQSMGNGE